MAQAAPGIKPPTTSSPVPAIAGQKRKRPTEKKFYAVKVGKTPGVYDTWEQCLQQVTGQKGAVCRLYSSSSPLGVADLIAVKSFLSQADAQLFVDGKLVPASSKQPGEQKFYAVQHGKTPGVYLDWPSAQQQISGFRNPRHKKFSTRAEAEAFVNEGKRKSAYDVGQGVSPEEEIRRLITKNSAPGMVMNGDYSAKTKDGIAYELGREPLPDGAEDGFDPNIKLDEHGEIVRRTLEEKRKTKTVPRDSDPPGMLRIYTDGSSLRNGQVGARAGVGVFFGPQDPKYDITFPTEFPVYTIDWQARGAPPKSKRRKLTWRYRNVSEALKGSKQTNQRAELTAIQRALDIAPSHRDITIYTDSKYAIDCVTNWYKGWMQRSWTNSKGKAVENKDLVQDIRGKIEERDLMGKITSFVWVKGHANNAGNIAADKLAVAGALKGTGESGATMSADDAAADEESQEDTDWSSAEDDDAVDMRSTSMDGATESSLQAAYEESDRRPNDSGL